MLCEAKSLWEENLTFADPRLESKTSMGITIKMGRNHDHYDHPMSDLSGIYVFLRSYYNELVYVLQGCCEYPREATSFDWGIYSFDWGIETGRCITSLQYGVCNNYRWSNPFVCETCTYDEQRQHGTCLAKNCPVQG